MLLQQYKLFIDMIEMKKQPVSVTQVCTTLYKLQGVVGFFQQILLFMVKRYWHFYSAIEKVIWY